MKFFSLVLILILPALLALPGHAQAPATATIVGNLSGSVAGQTVVVTVQASASGTASMLTGQGMDSSAHGGTLITLLGVAGECTWTLSSGSISGTSVSLSGTVVQSTGSFVGTSVSITGNSATGAIHFTFGTLTFSGTGTVAITN